MYTQVVFAALLIVAVSAAPSGFVVPSVPVATSSQNIFRISHSAYLAAPVAAPLAAPLAAPVASPFVAPFPAAVAAPLAAAPFPYFI